MTKDYSKQPDAEFGLPALVRGDARTRFGQLCVKHPKTILANLPGTNYLAYARG